ncbi:amidase [Brevibacterium litoralis]|uniref:amidase n=1 Tax=Brevibacterium litoralis TaxID=3138935 RepID=UPI0032EF2FB9
MTTPSPADPTATPMSPHPTAPSVDDPAYLELAEVSELLRTGRTTSLALTEHLLERIGRLDGGDSGLRSYVTLMADSARQAATAADAELAAGRWRGPLHGVPMAVKDLFHTVDAPTGAGMTVHRDFMASADATVVARLRAAGAVILGKLTMTEGALSEHHPDLLTPVNPWDADTWTGVSSSGSGVAAAAGLAYATLGTDTGGSIRTPSAQNGVTGLKPTWGLVSRHGAFDLAPSLDHIGPMGRSVRDVAHVLAVIAGPDGLDPTVAPRPLPDYTDLRLDRVPTVGVAPALMEAFDEPTRAMVDDTLGVVRGLGWNVVEVELPDFATANADWPLLVGVEVAHVHRDTYPARKDEYAGVLAGRIEDGLAASAVEYQDALERRRAFTGQMHTLFAGIDVLVLPGLGTASPTWTDMAAMTADPADPRLRSLPVAPINLANLPSLTLPAGWTDRGTPLGVQLVAGPWSEQLLLAAGHAYQQVTDHHRRHPEVRGVV